MRIRFLIKDPAFLRNAFYWARERAFVVIETDVDAIFLCVPLVGFDSVVDISFKWRKSSGYHKPVSHEAFHVHEVDGLIVRHRACRESAQDENKSEEGLL